MCWSQGPYCSLVALCFSPPSRFPRTIPIATPIPLCHYHLFCETIASWQLKLGQALASSGLVVHSVGVDNFPPFRSKATSPSFDPSPYPTALTLSPRLVESQSHLASSQRFIQDRISYQTISYALPHDPANRCTLEFWAS